MTIDITTIHQKSLLDKIIQLSSIRGEKMALNQKIEPELDEDIAVGKNEILRRLSLGINR